MSAESQKPELVRWRPWPCAKCRGGASLLDLIIGRHQAGGKIPGRSTDEIIEALSARERSWMVELASSCAQTVELHDSLIRLDEGSEHIVYLGSDGREVIKATKPGIFGDSYFLRDGRVHQRRCTPGDYLIRLMLLEDHFGFAPRALGVTAAGQIVSAQRFVEGEPPTQDDVDEFLISEGLDAVRRSCWLWKKADPDERREYWIGDARADNFVKTPQGIVPIDLRMWIVPLSDI